MNDMASAIVPKSDQLNADDLLSGPITILISGVSIKRTPEQPVAIAYDGDGGKPYKPCKSMCRVLVAAWGADSAKYVGRSLTLYCDPTVKWGGMEVGGIRISHMSDIESEFRMALTMTKGSRKPYKVKLLAVSKPTSTDGSPTQPRPSTQDGGASETVADTSPSTQAARKKALDAYEMASPRVRALYDEENGPTGRPITEMSMKGATRAAAFLLAEIDKEAAGSAA